MQLRKRIEYVETYISITLLCKAVEKHRELNTQNVSNGEKEKENKIN
jgi:hypothetical protein